MWGFDSQHMMNWYFSLREKGSKVLDCCVKEVAQSVPREEPERSRQHGEIQRTRRCIRTRYFVGYTAPPTGLHIYISHVVV